MKNFLTSKYLQNYKSKQKYTLHKHLNKIAKQGGNDYKFAFARSSVYSSIIEGNTLDIDTYFFNKEVGHQSQQMKQVSDLIKAYQFAKNHALNQNNLLKAHQLLTSNFDIPTQYKGAYRDKEVTVRDGKNKVVFRGCRAREVGTEMSKLFEDIAQLRKRKKITLDESFYYSSFAHLVCVSVHGFADGNGRISRLLEKWLLAELIGSKAWHVPSEAQYSVKRDTYYKNLKRVRSDYHSDIEYKYAVPFLLMLPFSFGLSKRYY